MATKTRPSDSMKDPFGMQPIMESVNELAALRADNERLRAALIATEDFVVDIIENTAEPELLDCCEIRDTIRAALGHLPPEPKGECDANDSPES